jgi:hypothetical protein
MLPWWVAWIFCIMTFIGGWLYGADHEKQKRAARKSEPGGKNDG